MPAGEEFNRRLMIYYSRINILLSAIDHNARNSIFRMNRIKKQLAAEYLPDCVIQADNPVARVNIWSTLTASV